MNAREYQVCRENLIFDILTAAGLVATQTPNSLRPGSKFARMSGSHLDNEAMRLISKKLGDVMYRYDQLKQCYRPPRARILAIRAPARGAR